MSTCIERRPGSGRRRSEFFLRISMRGWQLAHVLAVCPVLRDGEDEGWCLLCAHPTIRLEGWRGWHQF